MTISRSIRTMATVLLSMAIGFAARGAALDAAQVIPAPSSASPACIQSLLRHEAVAQRGATALLFAMWAVADNQPQVVVDGYTQIGDDAQDELRQTPERIERTCGVRVSPE